MFRRPGASVRRHNEKLSPPRPEKGLRVLVVDDEPLARRKLRFFLSDEPGISTIDECEDGAEALELIRRERPNLVFLDVRMPTIDGFDVMRRIKGGDAPDVVFVTAHDEYAVRAFEMEALDYLLKPFDRDRFRIALDRARRRLAVANSAGITTNPLDFQRIVVRSGGRILPLLAGKIEWIESADNYVRLHTSEQIYVVRETLASLEERLDRQQFLRIHRRAIVNLHAISEIRPLPHGGYEARLQGGQILRVGRTHLRFLRRCFGV
jgi:two-component system LytT family response regulator